jgi:hypothetical protein
VIAIIFFPFLRSYVAGPIDPILGPSVGPTDPLPYLSIFLLLHRTSWQPRKLVILSPPSCMLLPSSSSPLPPRAW